MKARSSILSTNPFAGGVGFEQPNAVKYHVQTVNTHNFVNVLDTNKDSYKFLSQYWFGRLSMSRKVMEFFIFHFYFTPILDE